MSGAFVVFDEEGWLTKESESSLWHSLESGDTLTGEAAAAWLANAFANETHGNYRPETLYRRSSLAGCYRLAVQRVL